MILPAFIEIAYILILLVGILMVMKTPRMSTAYRFIWVFIVLSLNLLGLIVFLIWNRFFKLKQ